MRKLIAVGRDEDIVGYLFACPGCEESHFLTVAPHQAPNGASWQFNGNLEKPTFQPSILSSIEPSPGSDRPKRVCHSFVTDGEIRFLSDCTHDLAGKTVELPVIPDPQPE